MKKLMIVAAVAMAAICSQGAQAIWGILTPGTMAPDAVGDEDFLWTGTAFLYSGTVGATSSAFNFGTATLLDIATELDAEAYTWGPTVNPVEVEDLASTAAGQAFSIILSDQVGIGEADLATYEGNYLLITGTSIAPGETADMQGGESTYYAKMLDESGNNYMGQWSTMAAGGGSEDVPEPTSGLLMLVGLAGLALRRKLA